MRMLLTILLAVSGAVIIIGFMAMPGESSAAQRAPFWGVNHAHRGLHSPDKSIPENSLTAFAAAVDGGYGIELDIQLTKDEEVVVFHDDDLERVCGVKGRVDSYTFEELKPFRLHGTDQPIPHLLEVLQLVDGRAPLIIELKTGPKNRILCQRAWRILRQYEGDICVESFDPRIVRWFKKYVPGLLRGQLAAPPAAMNAGLAGRLVGWGLSHFWGRPHFIAYRKGPRPVLVRLAHRLAMSVVWTATHGDDTEAMEDGYDAVIFEFYEPLPRYADPPGEPGGSPAGEEHRF
jgi:glycerophosphoryl diester phosphodiesterase